MKPKKTIPPGLIRKVIFRILSGFFIFSFLLFLPAGTVAYWQAWVYMAVLFTPMFFVMGYLFKNDPALLERRIRMKEKEKLQKLFIALLTPSFITFFVVPGLDFRFSWSSVPLWLIIIADVLVLLGYLFFFLVLRENSYASRIIEVEKGQKVITTGPYTLVRHPMYLSILVMYGVTPLALGSYWALLAILPLPFLLAARISNEEEVLKKNLPGYKAYVKKVRYRLIPFIY